MRIHSIKLLTKHLEELKKFYINELGVQAVDISNDSFTLKTGSSQLIFEQTDSEEGNPFYHFAFDIPENKLDESMAWLSSVGVSLNVLPGNSYQIHSELWNSTSIYFYDPAGNLVEFIARHTLDNASDTAFSVQSLINISEIGLVVHDVPSVKEVLNKNYLVADYKDSMETFAGLGDEDGLFILSAYKRIWLGSDKEADIFKTEVTVEGAHEGEFAMEQYPYKISFIKAT